tara:strand:- start:866 stop:1306 length:441 start_codon:yes stop_codon:yes gene_type:complete
MDKLLAPLLKGKTQRNVLLVLLAIFIVIDVKIPKGVADLANTLIGKILIIMVSISLVKVDPILGVFGLLAAYTFIQRIGGNHTAAEKRYVPSEDDKLRVMNSMNKRETTLEEMAVHKMKSMNKPNVFINADYKPILDMIHDAARIN